MKEIILLLIFLTTSFAYSPSSADCTFGSTGAEPGATDFVLVWADEFSIDGLPCSANWGYDIGGWGWGNNEAQYYTNRINNAFVQNGVLTIKAIKENFGGNEYTSARLLTKDKYEFTYGKVEIRAKLPIENGTWSALWMLGANFPDVPWPASGEIDIMEHTGNNENIVLGTTHNTAGFGGGGIGGNTAMPTPSEFHNYSIIWDESKIEFLVDDVLFFTYNPSPTNNNNYPYKSDFFLIMNVAIGGTLGGAIDPAFTDASMEIDYVRVYQKEAAPTPEPIADPIVSAPVPTINESNVVAAFSESYSTNTVTNFNPINFSGNGVVVSTDIDLESDGNLTVKLENLGFYGARWDALNVSSYSYVHLDYWATTSTDFSFFLIDQTAGLNGGEIEEPRYKIALAGGDETLVQGEWKSIFIPLQHFLDYDSGAFSYDLTDIYQWKFDGNGTLFFDNIYFSKENTLGTNDFNIADFNIYPNPSQDVWTISTINQNIALIQLFDIMGKEIISISTNKTEVKIVATNLSKGVYFAKIYTLSGTESIKKLIKN